VKIESLREVKVKLSKIVKELPGEKSVEITRNGRPCAVLFPYGRNGSRKHVTRSAKRFLAIAGPKRTPSLPPDYVNVNGKIDLMQKTRPDPQRLL
jgi:prevent-host-death family protein